MQQGLPAGLGVLLLTAIPLAAQTPIIDHQAVGCVVAGRFPRLDARFAPTDAVATARILFQSENSQQWYAVAMKPEGPAFFGVLPKPTKSLKAFRYYVEVVDRSLGTGRTSDYTARVVGSPADCKGKIVAGGLGSAAVMLLAPAGAPLVPAGFAATGVVAAGSGSATAAAGVAGASSGGGLGTGTIVAGAGALAAGAVVAAVARGSGPMTYTGPFTGQWTINSTFTVGGPQGPSSGVCGYTYSLSGTATAKLEQSNGTVTGDFSLGSVTSTEIGRTGSGPTCFSSPGYSSTTPNGGCQVTGSAADFGCNSQMTTTSAGPVTNTNTLAFSGGLSGGVVSGTVNVSVTFQGLGGTSYSASTTVPVTLR